LQAQPGSTGRGFTITLVSKLTVKDEFLPGPSKEAGGTINVQDLELSKVKLAQVFFGEVLKHWSSQRTLQCKVQDHIVLQQSFGSNQYSQT